MCTIGGGDHVIAIPKLIWGHAYMGLYQWVIEGQKKIKYIVTFSGIY